MNIIGLDLSLTSTGVADKHGTWTIKPSGTGPTRLTTIRDQLSSSLDPDSLIAMEGYSYASKSSNAHSTGELGGVIKVMFYAKNIPYVVIPPTARAKFATGKGNANKSAVVSSVSARTGISFPTDDETDAWILQEMGLAHYGIARFEWPKINLSALESIDWTPWDERIEANKPN